MKILPVFLLLVIDSNGQQYPGSDLIIQNAIRLKQDTGKIVCLDRSIGYDNSIRQIMRKRRIKGFCRDSLSVNMGLKYSERKAIIRQFTKNHSITWADSLFSNAGWLSPDSIYYDSRIEYDSLGKKYKIKFFAFGEPVYLRNNSICIFQFIYMFGSSAGYKMLYFYKKEDDVWRLSMISTLGAW